MKKLNVKLIPLLIALAIGLGSPGALVLAENISSQEQPNKNQEERQTTTLSSRDRDRNSSATSDRRENSRDNSRRDGERKDSERRHQDDRSPSRENGRDREDVERENEGGNGTSTTPTVLAVSNVLFSSVTSNSASVAWTTNLSSTGSIMFGTSSGLATSGGTVLNDPSGPATSHNLGLTGLMPGTTYFLTVQANGVGQTATSAVMSFVTTPTATTTPTFTLANIALHNTVSNCWTAVSGSVYDLTSYAASHPGGSGAISLLCGIDGTALFNAQHAGQTNPLAELAMLKIGTLAI